MASLAGREGLSGQVQMIFFDPPFGINFNSNFQTKTNKLDSKGSPKDLPNDTRTVTAFRDTYERGIHSYLDQLLEKLTLCRDLLTDSGSIFVQIGEDNLHRMALVLDEVFGPDNRMSQITFVTTGGGSSKTLPSSANYLLWYAKDKIQVRYQQLYEPLDRKGIVDLFTSYAQLELPDGTPRPLTAREKVDPDQIPTGARIFQRSRLTSPGHDPKGRSNPYTWNGVKYPCGDTLQWRVSHFGLDRLAELNRLDASTGGKQTSLSMKRYENEVPGRRINNVWHRQMSTSDKRYVVQTANPVIQRCMLMTTYPGDLVFDPTCGAGTTAAVAEHWGRRWITCDTSPISVAIARQRLITTTYPYWVLADSSEGHAAEEKLRESLSMQSPHQVGEAVDSKDPTQGFVYNRVPYVSAKTLAYDEDPDPTFLVDDPVANKSIARVASSFTVESSSPWTYVPYDAETDQSSQARSVEHSDFVQLVVDQLLLQPIDAGRNTAVESSSIQATEIEPWATGSWTSHLVSYVPASDPNQKPRLAGLCVPPEDVTVTERMLSQAALDTARHIPDADLVIVVALAFDPEATQDKVGSVNVMRVVAHRDLFIGDLKAAENHQAFVMLGQPEVEVKTEDNGELTVELLGYDTYDPASGTVDEGGKDDVNCWMIDTDYNGESFFARRIHFPGKDKDKLIAKLKRELGKSFDDDRWKCMLSTESAPFSPPSTGKIAVKVITTAGNEMSVVKDCP